MNFNITCRQCAWPLGSGENCPACERAREASDRRDQRSAEARARKAAAAVASTHFAPRYVPRHRRHLAGGS